MEAAGQRTLRVNGRCGINQRYGGTGMRKCSSAVRGVLVATLVSALPVAALAQTESRQQAAPAPRQPPASPAATPAPAAPAPAVRREGQPVNIKVEVTITDQRGGAPPVKKTVNVVTGDLLNGSIRTQARYTGAGAIPLNIDAEPQILADSKIRLRLNMQYSLPGGAAADTEPTGRMVGSLQSTDIQESLSLILDNGKSTIAAQSADPVGDRQVTIEVKATIQR